jgi:acyl carrier protein
LDRKALPIPDRCQPALEESYVPPRSPEEEMIVEIWAEVLKVDRVGVHDNFFDLGGHSLLATRVISEVRKVFQVELPLRSLFEAPTVAGLALRVEQSISNAGELAELGRNLTEVESLSDYEIEQQLDANTRS